jgi:hypothetical protein
MGIWGLVGGLISLGLFAALLFWMAKKATE